MRYTSMHTHIRTRTQTHTYKQVHLPLLFTDDELQAARRRVPPGQQHTLDFHVNAQRRRTRHLHRVCPKTVTKP